MAFSYVFMKPLALPKPSEVHPGRAWAFPFDYISPTNFPDEMRKLFSEEHGPVHIIPNTGPAPLLMQREDWELVTPDWERLAAVIEADKDLVAKLGWVREMYGFSVALALQGIGVDLAKPPQNRFISQLPIDDGLGEAHAFHYTQCTIYKTISGEKDVW
jgi:hydroxyproline O-arabinosyltransferase